MSTVLYAIVSTQYHENYGYEGGINYWKAKGGSDYIVGSFTVGEITSMEKHELDNTVYGLIEQFKVEYHEEWASEHVMGWHLDTSVEINKVFKNTDYSKVGTKAVELYYDYEKKWEQREDESDQEPAPLPYEEYYDIEARLRKAA